jgi:hypothetical protein
MHIFKFCFVVLMVVILSNAIAQNETSLVDGPYEEVYGSDDDIDLDYYPDSDYDDWKPFPGKKLFILL